jgi:Glycosyl hydrolases family 25
MKVALTGVDVSNWQGDFDWTQAKSKGWSFGAAKATEGTSFVDPQFTDNFAEMKQAGLARIAYLFLHPAASALKQCILFDKVIQSAGFSVGDLIAVDSEVTDGASPGQIATVTFNVAYYMALKYRCSPFIYTYQDFTSNLQHPDMGNFPLWRADPGGVTMPPPSPWTQVAMDQYATAPQDQDRAYFSTKLQLERLAMQPEQAPLPAFPGVWKEIVSAQEDAMGVWHIVLVGLDGALHSVTGKPGAWNHPASITGPITRG